MSDSNDIKRYAYLVYVDANNNHNKFYEITEHNDFTVSVKYGRVGNTPSEKIYGRNKTFDSLLNIKLEKGYTDETANHAQIITDKQDRMKAELSYKPIEDEDVQELMTSLISASRDFFQKNYEIKSCDITPKMISEAENDINDLVEIAYENTPNKLFNFNNTLQILFKDIPRKMNNVSDYLATSENDFDRILQREIDMLDNIRGQVELAKADLQNENPNQTILEKIGVSVRPVTYKEEDQIMAHLGVDYNKMPMESRYMGAFAVENSTTRAAYNEYKKERHIDAKGVRLFYHGSKEENWYSIMKTGLSLNPNASKTGSMFGVGLYFAPELRKSANYMDTYSSVWNKGATKDYGYCGVYAVALGKCFQPTRPSSQYDEAFVRSKGCDSLFAGKKNPYLNLKNDEYVVFNKDACTIKYLMKIDAAEARAMVYNVNRKVLRDEISKGFSTVTKIPNGLRAELAIENLNEDAQAEINKLTERFDATHIYFDYNNANDKISISISDINDERMDIYPVITSYDYKFLTRELKKSFAESEKDWKNIVKVSEQYPLNRVVAEKDRIVPLNDEIDDNDNQTVKVQTLGKE